MTLSAGTRLGPYEVTAKLGEGGMGEVYRAKDTRLGRTVAIKVLPSDLAADPERRRRFEQEARAVSALNHPHICILYDIGSTPASDVPGAPPTDYLVMEHLEGQTLAERLAKGPLPLREVVEGGAQVADALAKAHRHGILHRDIKPGNVMLTKAGAKLLDFGLAKARPGSGALDAGVTVSLTRGPVTSAGLVVGTVPYMAPEVLEGKEADARADIFALGAVLYEMVAGRRAFVGESQASLIAAILTSEPAPLTAGSGIAPVAAGASSASGIRPGLGTAPPALDRLIRRCLAKDPDDRWQSAGDIARQLEGLAEEWRFPSPSATQIPVVVPTSSRLRAAARLGLGVLAIAGLGAGAYIVGQRVAAHPQPTYRRLTFRQGTIGFGIPSSGGARFTADGQYVVYTAQWDGAPPETFMVRTDGVDSEPRDAFKGMRVHAISSRNEVAVTRGRTLLTAPLTGGAPREVARSVYSADWSPDGSRLAVTRRDNGRAVLEYPIGTAIYKAQDEGAVLDGVRLSPGGDRLAFREHAGSYGRVVIIDHGGKKHTQSSSLDSISPPAWSPDGQEVWFSRQASGGGFDSVRALSASGRERTMLRSPGVHLVDAARDGRVLLTTRNAYFLLYGRGPGEANERNLTHYGWSVLDDMSPDGQKVLFTEGGDSTPTNTWSSFLRPTGGGPPQAACDCVYGKLSPDGKWVAGYWDNPPEGKGSAIALAPTGAGQQRLMTPVRETDHHVADWLPDSSGFLFVSDKRVWLAPLDGTPRAITPEGWSTSDKSVSPDGRHYLCANDRPDDPWAHLCGIDEPVSASLPRLFDMGKWEAMGWSADGKTLRVNSKPYAMPLRVFLLDPATGVARPWREIGAQVDRAGFMGIPRVMFSADGESYAYSFSRQLMTLYVAEGVR